MLPNGPVKMGGALSGRTPVGFVEVGRVQLHTVHPLKLSQNPECFIRHFFVFVYHKKNTKASLLDVYKLYDVRVNDDTFAFPGGGVALTMTLPCDGSRCACPKLCRPYSRPALAPPTLKLRYSPIQCTVSLWACRRNSNWLSNCSNRGPSLTSLQLKTVIIWVVLKWAWLLTALRFKH